MFNTNKKTIIEGVALLSLYMNNQYKKMLLNQPMIIIGKSAVTSSIQAILRNKKINHNFLKLSYVQSKMNINVFNKQINQLRKEIINMNDKVIKPFIVPKL